MTKVIRIDPFIKSVHHTDVDLQDIQTLYRAMSPMFLSWNVDMIEIGHTMPDHNLIVDEEGMFKPNQRAFRFAGKVFFGSALILGVQDYEWTACSLGLVDIEDAVAFEA